MSSLHIEASRSQFVPFARFWERSSIARSVIIININVSNSKMTERISVISKLIKEVSDQLVKIQEVFAVESALIKESCEQREEIIREKEAQIKLIKDETQKERQDSLIKLNSAKEELNDVKNELNDVKNELNDVKEELNNAKEELNNAKEELNNAKEELNNAKEECSLQTDILSDTEHHVVELEEELSKQAAGFKDQSMKSSAECEALAERAALAEQAWSKSQAELEKTGDVLKLEQQQNADLNLQLREQRKLEIELSHKIIWLESNQKEFMENMESATSKLRLKLVRDDSLTVASLGASGSTAEEAGFRNSDLSRRCNSLSDIDTHKPKFPYLLAAPRPLSAQQMKTQQRSPMDTRTVVAKPPLPQTTRKVAPKTQPKQ